MNLFIIDQRYSYVDDWIGVKPSPLTFGIHGCFVVISCEDRQMQMHRVQISNVFNVSNEVVHKWYLEAHIERHICRWNEWTDFFQLTTLAKAKRIPVYRGSTYAKYYACGAEFAVYVSDDKSCWQYILVSEDEDEFASPIYPSSIPYSIEHFTQWVNSTIYTQGE